MAVDPGRIKSRTKAVASSDEEFEAFITEETFRVGWPSLTPLPAEFECAQSQEDYDDFFVDHNEAYSTFQSILASQSVDVLYIDLGWQCTLGATSANKTLRVIAQGKETGTTSWHNAALRLSRSAQEMAIEDPPIHVEIVELGFPQLFPVERENIALQNWSSSLAPMVMDTLKQKSLLWQSLSLVRIGCASFTDSVPTVLIEAAKATDSRWGPMIGTLLEAMKDLPCKLQVWQMDVIDTTGDPNTDNLYPRMWGKVMSVGDGIAAQGSSANTGTVGGFLALENDPSPYILTNFHVVATDRMESELLPTPLRAFCLPKGSTKYPMKVPADFDTKLFINFRERLLAEDKEGLDETDNGTRPSIAKKAEYGDERSAALVARYNKKKHDHNQLMSSVRTHAEHCSGNVRAASGYQHVDLGGNFKVGFDWALVEMDRSRVPDSSLPNDDVRSEHGLEIPSWAKKSAQKWTVAEKASERVVKLGRMTGWTAGLLNKAPTYWRALAKDDFEVEQRHDRYGVVVTCIQVLQQKKGKDRPPFAACGDSGAIVRDEETGAWVGLLFGAHRDGWGLATPIDAVFSHIEKVTRKKVVEPSAL